MVTDRLPVYMIILEPFCTEVQHCGRKHCGIKLSFLNCLESNFSSPHFKAYLTRTVLGVYTRTFGYGSKRDLLSRWTCLGTDSSSIWNGSISSRLNARPMRTYLGKVPFGTVPV